MNNLNYTILWNLLVLVLFCVQIYLKIIFRECIMDAGRFAMKQADFDIMEKAKSRTCSCEKHFCFYNSIMYAFGDLSPAPSFWATPLGMKKFLKIGETDEIEIKHVALLEPKMKVCVSVVGDEDYVSDATYPKKITLTLRDGHYSYFSKKTELTKVWVQGLKYVLFRKIDDHFLTYDGDELVADYDLALEDLANSTEKTYKRFNELTEEQTEKLDSLFEDRRTSRRV